MDNHIKETQRLAALAEDIVNSAPVIGTYAACEWDELHGDGKQWIIAIVREAQARAAAPELLEAAQHTPGPWVAERFERPHSNVDLIGFRVIARGACDGRDLQICESYPRPTPVAVNEHNARLIAAAPELLAEARELLRNATYADGYGMVLTQDCEALEAAIAKATS